MKKLGEGLQSFKTRRLCTGCGSCESICPAHCIRVKKTGTDYKSFVDIDQCVNCGLCLELCPAWDVDFEEFFPDGQPEDLVRGKILEAYVTWSKDTDLRKRCASGGFITSTLLNALESGMVDAVSIVDIDCPDKKQAKMRLSSSREDIIRSAGSYYAYVNISSIIDILAKNKGKRLAIVGLPCQFYSMFKLLTLKNIPRDNLYFIGLICSKSQSYKIFDYYRESYTKTNLKEVNFRHKAFRGAPGEVRITDVNGAERLLPLEERRALTKFYRNKRCLYCFDQYNILSDLAVGDCFIEGLESSEGENLVIVRSQKGSCIFNSVKEFIVYKELPKEKLAVYGQGERLSRKAGAAIGLYPKEKNRPLTLKDIVKILYNEMLMAFGHLAPTKLIQFLVWRKKELRNIRGSFRNE